MISVPADPTSFKPGTLTHTRYLSATPSGPMPAPACFPSLLVFFCLPGALCVSPQAMLLCPPPLCPHLDLSRHGLGLLLSVGHTHKVTVVDVLKAVARSTHLHRKAGDSQYRTTTSSSSSCLQAPPPPPATAFSARPTLHCPFHTMLPFCDVSTSSSNAGTPPYVWTLPRGAVLC